MKLYFEEMNININISITELFFITLVLSFICQSGDLFSHHYNDLAMAWSTGEYLRMDIEAQNEWGNETIVDRRVLEP